MAKFNQTNRVQADSTNMAGGASYSRNDFKKELASVVLNSMINGDSYYESETDRLNRIENSINENLDNAEFAAKAMVYTRNKGNLRSISHFMTNVLAENVKGSNFLRSAITKTIVRPDDMTEMLALWNARNGNKMLPNSVRRAFKDSLETKFDEYQFRKYQGLSNAVKLKDVVKLAHPSPKNFEDETIFKRIIEDELRSIETAQTVNAEKTGEERAQSYKNMLSNRKLGYMAALKNIKNILESGADKETIEMLCDLLSNERAVLKSRVLPFRFTQAYKMVSELSMDRILNKKVLKAIEDGFVISAKNVAIVDEDESVALMLDDSYSMQGAPYENGVTLMASMLAGLDKQNVVGYLWSDRAEEVSVDGSPMEFIRRNRPRGGGTDIKAAIYKLIETNTFVDKIVIFTDMQMYDINRGWGHRNEDNAEFRDYAKAYRKINPNVKVLFWNLQGYGKGTPMKLDHDILEVSGFSDRMLEVIPKIWKDKDALIKEIEAIEL